MLREGTYARVYCVVDGLDVYQEGMNELIIKLAEIFDLRTEAKSPVLKLLCTARPERSILELLKTSKHTILHSSPHDLNIFIHSRVRSLGESFTDDMKQVIIQELHKQAENSFLWLEVVIKRIRSMYLPNKRKITETIENSPRDLDNLYYLLVQHLVQRDRDNARLLACVIYARYPLTLRALQDAMAINPREKYTNYKQCEQDKLTLTPNEFYNMFGTLLNVTEDRVYCIHQSVKDYFERRNPL